MLKLSNRILPRFGGRPQLGRYEILGRIATGGMATVYRGRLRGVGGFSREFAIKVIHPHLCHAPEFADRFQNEARLASRIHHPNVVSTVDTGQAKGLHYIVLELVDGVNLRQVTSVRSLSLPPAQAARIVADAARGLHALHTQPVQASFSDDSVGGETSGDSSTPPHDRLSASGRGKTLTRPCHDPSQAPQVVHRDLSPHNLMLDVTGRTVLIDLGLAKVRGQEMHTQTGVLCGKLAYMSPEQSRGEEVDIRSDIFSLGAVLFELVTGSPPFGEDHTPGTLERLRRCDQARLADLLRHAGAPAWLSTAILTCLRREPEQRFQTAMALAGALEDEAHFAGIDLSDVRQQLATLASRVAQVRQQATEEQQAALGEHGPAMAALGNPHHALDPNRSGTWSLLSAAQQPGGSPWLTRAVVTAGLLACTIASVRFVVASLEDDLPLETASERARELPEAPRNSLSAAQLVAPAAAKSEAAIRRPAPAKPLSPKISSLIPPRSASLAGIRPEPTVAQILGGSDADGQSEQVTTAKSLHLGQLGVNHPLAEQKPLGESLNGHYRAQGPQQSTGKRRSGKRGRRRNRTKAGPSANVVTKTLTPLRANPYQP